MLFIAQITVTETGYMNDPGKPQRLVRLVEAEDYKDAEKKLENAFPDDPYSVYYQVEVNDLSEVIT